MQNSFWSRLVKAASLFALLFVLTACVGGPSTKVNVSDPQNPVFSVSVILQGPAAQAASPDSPTDQAIQALLSERTGGVPDRQQQTYDSIESVSYTVSDLSLEQLTKLSQFTGVSNVSVSADQVKVDSVPASRVSEAILAEAEQLNEGEVVADTFLSFTKTMVTVVLPSEEFSYQASNGEVTAEGAEVYWVKPLMQAGQLTVQFSPSSSSPYLLLGFLAAAILAILTVLWLFRRGRKVYKPSPVSSNTARDETDMWNGPWS